MGNLDAAAAPASEGERWRAVPRRLSRKSEGNSKDTKAEAEGGEINMKGLRGEKGMEQNRAQVP